MWDYKMQSLEDEHKRQYNSVEAWIYIGIDTDRMGMAKIRRLHTIRWEIC